MARGVKLMRCRPCHAAALALICGVVGGCIVEFNRPGAAGEAGARADSAGADVADGLDTGAPDRDRSTADSQGSTDAAAADKAGAACAGAVCVSTVAGSCLVPGYLDAAAPQALFYYPSGVAVAKNGAIYVADRNNHCIRLILNGKVTTLAGACQTSGYADGAQAAALFNLPTGVAVDPAGAVLVADQKNHRIRKIVATKVTTLAGGSAGFMDGTLAQARFSSPTGLTVSNGLIHVADMGNHRVRVLSASSVTTLAGNATAGYIDGAAVKARFNQPYGIAIDSGKILVADRYNHRIRGVSASKVDTLGGIGKPGFKDGATTIAQLHTPLGAAYGPAGVVYVADTGNHRIRKIASGNVSTLAGSQQGFADGPGGSARFDMPSGIAVGPTGAIFIADLANHCIRRLTIAGAK